MQATILWDVNDKKKNKKIQRHKLSMNKIDICIMMP